jgi:4'-phosphopantetheinyl transferase
VNPLVILLSAERDLDGGEFSALLALVSPEQRDRIRRRRSYRAAQNTLLGDVMVRREISQRAGIPPERVAFRISGYGKPFAEGDIHFNISHSGNVVAVVVDTRPAGIDVELPVWRPGVPGAGAADGIMRRFFAPDERLYVGGREGRERFYEVWTMKEAYGKKAGTGLVAALRDISVFRPPPGNFFYKLMADGIIGHVCSSRPAEPEFRRLGIRDFLGNGEWAGGR